MLPFYTEEAKAGSSTRAPLCAVGKKEIYEVTGITWNEEISKPNRKYSKRSISLTKE
jgi:hypothetical protein